MGLVDRLKVIGSKISSFFSRAPEDKVITKKHEERIRSEMRKELDNLYKSYITPYLKGGNLDIEASYPSNIKEFIHNNYINDTKLSQSRKKSNLTSNVDLDNKLQEIRNSIDKDYSDVYNKTAFFSASDLLYNTNLNMSLQDTGFHASDVNFFKNIVEKDPHVYGATWSIINNVTSRKWSIEPSKNSDRGLKIANFIEDVFKNHIKDFTEVIATLAKSIITGYSVQEIIWDNVDGYIIPVAIKHREESLFEFNPKGELFFRKQGSYMGKGQKVPRSKFLIHSYKGNSSNPYGSSIIGERVFWMYYFKRIVWRFRLRFLERFGNPLTIHKYSTPEERIRMNEALRYMATKGAIQVPLGSEVEFAEAVRNTQDFQDTLKDLNTEIQIAICGQTATMDRENGGSYASDYIRQDQFYTIVSSLNQSIESTINNSLIKPMVRMNFPREKGYSSFVFSKQDDVLKRKEVERDMFYIRQQVPMNVAHLLRNIGHPIPSDMDTSMTTAPYWDTHGNVKGGLPPELRHQVRTFVNDPRLESVDPSFEYESYDSKIDGEDDPDAAKQKRQEDLNRRAQDVKKSPGQPAEGKGSESQAASNPKNNKK